MSNILTIENAERYVFDTFGARPLWSRFGEEDGMAVILIRFNDGEYDAEVMIWEDTTFDGRVVLYGEAYSVE